MTIPCPVLQWPTSLLEVGPGADRSILLSSDADIAGARYSVVAIRVDPITLTPDFLSGLPSGTYANSSLRGLFDDLSSYTDISEGSVVRLDGGNYVFLLLPAPEGELGF